MILSASKLPVSPVGPENGRQDDTPQNDQRPADPLGDSQPHDSAQNSSLVLQRPSGASDSIAGSVTGPSEITRRTPQLAGPFAGHVSDTVSETSLAPSPLPPQGLSVPPAATSSSISVPATVSPAVLLANAYDALRQRLTAQPLRRNSLFLSSADADTETTATAIHLARSLAVPQARTPASALPGEAPSVLLVELRLTSPQLRSHISQPASTPGFEEALRGRVPLDDCIVVDPKTKSPSSLSILSVNKAMTVEEAAHQAGPLNDFLQWAEEQFEWLVLDCPPIASPEWIHWLELNADPVVLIVRAGFTRKRAVQRAARRLKDRLACAILVQP